MIYKKNIIIVIIFLTILFVGMVGVLVYTSLAGKLTEGNTTAYTATVRKVQVAGAGQPPHAEIITEEYTNSLYVTESVAENIDLNILKKINPRQKVFFRIKTSKCSLLNKVEFIDIVALKTNDADIFSLAQYNQFFNQAAFPAKIAGAAVAVLFLILQIRMLLRLKNTNKSRFC